MTVPSENHSRPIFLIQHVPFEGAGLIEQWLSNSGRPYEWISIMEHDLFPDLSTVGGVIILGGPMSVNDGDRYPWIKPETAFISECISQGIPVLGICLGAQFIAKSQGAKVYPNPIKEIGWFPIKWLDQTAFGEHRALPQTMEVFHWHGETFDIPSNARWIASTPECSHQAFMIGQHVLALQFHLEMESQGIDQLITYCGSDIDGGPKCQETGAMITNVKFGVQCHEVLHSILEHLFVAPSQKEHRGSR